MILTQEQANRIADVMRNFNVTEFNKINDEIRTELANRYSEVNSVTIDGIRVMKFYEGAVMALLSMRALYDYVGGIEDEIVGFYEGYIDTWVTFMTNVSVDFVCSSSCKKCGYTMAFEMLKICTAGHMEEVEKIWS